METNSPLSGDFQSWQRQQPTEWGPLRAEDGCYIDADGQNKFRFTTGVYSNVLVPILSAPPPACTGHPPCHYLCPSQVGEPSGKPQHRGCGRHLALIRAPDACQPGKSPRLAGYLCPGPLPWGCGA